MEVRLIVFLVLLSSCSVLQETNLSGFLPAKGELSQIELPEGFHIEYYAGNVSGARSLAKGENHIFVGSRGAGNVYALHDTDGDYRADEIITIASGLNSPNGVAFKDRDLYVAEIDRILRFNNIEKHLEDAEYEVLFDGYPEDAHHGWKYIAFGPDERLYVPVGAPCNICEPQLPYASITRLNENFSEYEIVAQGIRNTVGFDWHPGTAELWFTDNGRDWLGNNQPPDELNHVTEQGQHFGYPFCHGSDIKDPEFGGTYNCAESNNPAIKLGPHVAALGMVFYTGTMFPPEYAGDIFIAEHGSWNRDPPIGYRVTRVHIEQSTATEYSVFASGWLQGEKSWGRPVDILQMPDGSLLISDDKNDAVYRVTYQD